MKVSILSFNQGNAWKKDQNITETELAQLESFLSQSKDVDIIVIGLQEANNFLLSIVEPVLQFMNYNLCCSYTRNQMLLGQLSIYVWIKNKWINSIDYIKKDYYNCSSGPSNLLQIATNSTIKGSLIVDINIRNRHFIFANCHLPFDPKNPKSRTNCLLKICEKINMIGNKDTNSIFIFGDLNYRTSDQKVITIEDKQMIDKFRCSSTNLQKTITTDQLHLALRTNPLKLYKLREANITFCPTCKFQYSNKKRNYNNKRIPSWCDRILFKGDMVCKKYKSLLLSTNSDHNAVYANFIVY